jgi:hypothetical protein
VGPDFGPHGNRTRRREQPPIAPATAKTRYWTVPMTMHNIVMVRHMLTSKTACIGLESNTDARPRGILLCKELPISLSRKDQRQCRVVWFNYAGFLAAPANYSLNM